MKKIGILHYGSGNIASLINVLIEFDVFPIIVDSEIDLLQFDMLILPGVGTYNVAMDFLHSKKLIKQVKKFSESGKPILGICLGMHILSKYGDEGGGTMGLDLIQGRVIKAEFDNHTGWSNIIENQSMRNPLIRCFYFNHEYIYEDSDHKVGWVNYKSKNIISIVKNVNIIGVQFHPENSQNEGKLFFRELFLEYFGN